MCNNRTRVDGGQQSKTRVFTERCVFIDGDIAFPFANAYFLYALAMFTRKGCTPENGGKCLNLVGDATHNETYERSKRIIICGGGLHFHEKTQIWRTIVIHGIYVGSERKMCRFTCICVMCTLFVHVSDLCVYFMIICV